MKKSIIAISTQKLTALIGFLTVILCIAFGAGGAFIAKQSDGNSEWKYPYMYFYEVWEDVPLETLSYDLAKDPQLYGTKIEKWLSEGFKAVENNFSKHLKALDESYDFVKDIDLCEMKFEKLFGDLKEELKNPINPSLYDAKLSEMLDGIKNRLLQQERSEIEKQKEQGETSSGEGSYEEELEELKNRIKYEGELDKLLLEFKNRFKRQTKNSSFLEKKSFLNKAYYLSLELPTKNVSALWYATVLPVLFGVEVVAFFFITEIVLLVLLCIKIWKKGLFGSRDFVIKIALAAYLVYLSSFFVLFMINRTVILGMSALLSFSPIIIATGTTLSFSPVTIVGLVLGALCVGTLLLQNFIGEKQKDVSLKANTNKRHTVLLLLEIVLFIAVSTFILLPVFNVFPNGKIGFLETFFLTALESKYDSLEMFLALFGFVAAVAAIGFSAKGIYNRLYYLMYDKKKYGERDISPLQSILAVTLSCLIGLTAYAIKGVLAKASHYATSATFDLHIGVEILPIILLCLVSIAILSIMFVTKGIRKKNAETK